MHDDPSRGEGGVPRRGEHGVTTQDERPRTPGSAQRPTRRRRIRPLTALIVAAAVAVAVVTAALVLTVGGLGSTDRSATGAAVGRDSDVDQVIGQLVSVFENGTPEIQYAYVEDLDDGRGYTAGRAGFCTACGDLLTVVKTYTAQVPGNPLAKYLPTLTVLARSSEDSTDGLDGFEDAWRAAAEDPVFRQVQDQVTDTLYVAPARQIAADNGVRSALGLAILVDTAVQQGTDTDPDSLPSVVTKTNATVGGTPADGVDETTWLRGFLATRRAVLEHPSSPDTTDVWRDSVGRVDALSALLDAGNLDLTTPFTVSPFGDPQTIT